jgi:type I restriction enzyme S subunit
MNSNSQTSVAEEEAKPVRVPKLRFPEFRGEESWENKLIGPYLEDCSGRVPPDTELPVYSSTREGLKRQDAYFDGRVLQNKNDYGVVPPGCLVYRHMSDDGLFKFNINETGGEIAVSKEYPVFSTKGLNSVFLLAKLNDGLDFKHFALSQKAGGTRTRLYFSRLCEWRTLLPYPAEQQKIAECLSSVDELMAAQARKVDALKTHKKGLMQQLFPREGETQPRVRFAEFQNAGEWEPETLENVCAAKISYGIVQAGPHVPNGMPYIKSTDLNSELCLANMARTSEAIAQKYRRSEVVPGDIVFSLRGNIGVAQILPEGIPVANLTQGTARIRTKGPPEFYFHALRSPSVNGRIQAVGKGSTFQEISLEALRNIRLFHPKPAEQQRIASCLSSLDTLITAETQKHEALKTHKKGLMQKLFPSPEKVEPCKR